MTIARAAFAAMYQPSSGTRVCRWRPSGPFEHELGVVDALVDHGHRPLRVASGGARQRGDRDARPLDEGAPPVGVHRDDAAACTIGLEEFEFRGEVVVHRRVVVEVVVAQVREADHVEDDAVDTVTGERLCGDLDRDRAHRFFAHPGEQSVELARLRGGQLARDRRRCRCGARPSSSAPRRRRADRGWRSAGRRRSSCRSCR